MRTTGTLASFLVTICVAAAYAGRLPWPDPEPDWYTMESDFEMDVELGNRVSGMGDVNGDGYDDVFVGSGHRHVQGAYFYYGSTKGLPDNFSQRFESYPRGGPVGDVNGDGFADMIAIPASFEPRVYHGTAQGFPETPAVILNKERMPHDVFSVVGDVNGDGFADLAGGHSMGDCGGENSGCVGVLYGSSSGLSATPDWTVGGKRGDRLGIKVSRGGDVNGDGFGDLIALSDGVASNNTTTYAAVFLGSASGLSKTPAWKRDFGTSSIRAEVGSAGDVNNDGFDDIICYLPGKACEIYAGSGSGLGKTPIWKYAVDKNYEISVSSIGDFNGDGVDDIALGKQGDIFIFYGTQSSGPSTTPDRTIEGKFSFGMFGRDIAYVGDVNGDGGDDFAVGAPAYFCAGMAFVYHGTPGKAAAKRGLRKAAGDRPLITYAPGRLLLNTNLSAGETVTIRVVDFMGNTVMSRTVRATGSVRELPFSRTAHGTYGVSVRSGDNTIRQRITVVRRR